MRRASLLAAGGSPGHSGSSERGRRLSALEGRTSPEDLLDRIFARFCLGK